MAIDPHTYYTITATVSTTASMETMIVVSDTSYTSASGNEYWIEIHKSPVEEINYTDWFGLRLWSIGFKGTSISRKPAMTIRQPGSKDRRVNKRKTFLRSLV